MTFAHPGGSIALHSYADEARQLLTDTVAQLDAIAAQRTDETDQ